MIGTTTDGWQHPWLRLERALRTILAVRLERGSRENVDRALMTIVQTAPTCSPLSSLNAGAQQRAKRDRCGGSVEGEP